ncbi:MAG: hypothetical protein K2O91_10615 [Lachnospiraceae bacterium]|nr:hypothetical protein [Lachnospiraceae bacterium]
MWRKKEAEYCYDIASNIGKVWDNGENIAKYEYNADGIVIFNETDGIKYC